jgi:hypothetical protein
MKNKWIAAAIGVAASALSASAHAALVNRTFNLVATDFQQVFGSDPTLPPSPVTMNFTLKFDDSAYIDTTTTGLTVNSFTLPYTAEYQYFSATDAISLATYLTAPATCDSTASSFCAFINDATSSTPTLIFFQHSLPTYNVWRASSMSMTYTDARGGGGVGPGVPEPATWAMMLIGFGGLGAQLRRRRANRLSLAA